MSTYRFSAALALRLLGSGVVAVGIGVLVWVVVAVAFGVPQSWFAAGLFVAFALLLLVLGLTLLLRRRVVVRFDDAGYRIAMVRGCGVRRAEWRLVDDVVTSTVSGHRCVVLRLADGRTTTVPVDLLAATTQGFVEDLRAHLRRGHGYREFAPTPGDR